MASPTLEVALFASDDAGVRMLGRSTEHELVEMVRDRIAAERRRELSEIEPPVRLVRPSEDASE